jgi:hypothetical protein
MPNPHEPNGNTSETLLRRHEEKITQLQNIEDAVKKLFLCGDANLGNNCENHGQENELRSRPYVKNSTVNIRYA